MSASHSSHAQALRLKQKIASRKGDSEDRVQTPSTQSAAESKYTPLTQREKVELALAKKDLGNNAVKALKYEDALFHFSSAIELNPTEPTFFANRSAAYSAVHDYKLALKDAEQAMKLKPNWNKAVYRKAFALEGLKLYNEAEAAFKAAYELDQTDAAVKKTLDEFPSRRSKSNGTESKEQDSSSVSSSKDLASPEDDRYEVMINWMKDGGCVFPYLDLRYYSHDYRGVHAAAPISNNKIILEVPRKLIMTSEVAKESIIGKKILGSGYEVASTHSFLACYLCQEKHNPTSYWKPYIDTLPQHYRNMPIFFDEKELELLKGSFAIGKINDRKNELREEYDNICRFVPDFKQYTHEEFVWARMVVITRIFGLVIDKNKTDGLVPMADMLNHKRPRQTSWEFNEARDSFTITSMEEIERGDQVYDSYGRKCNSRFFVNYGFSLEENEDNQVAMFFTLPESDPHYLMKMRLLGASSRSSVERRRFQMPTIHTEEFWRDCMSFLRFINAKDSELAHLQAAERLDIRNIDPISLRNELACMDTLREQAKEVLAGFPTTLDQDNASLKDLSKLPMYSNNRNAVLMRRGEKEVLQHYMQLPDEVRKIQGVAPKEMKKLIQKHYNSPTNAMHQYVQAIIVPLINRERA